jgi:hypothetical protein
MIEYLYLPGTVFAAALGEFTERAPPSSSIRDNASSSKRRSEGCLADFGTSATVDDARGELQQGP